MLKSIELFAGGGGLLLGSAMSGVEHVAAVEWNQWACKTMRENVANDHRLVRGMTVIEGDVRSIDWKAATNGQEIDIVSGGPPCQPFSLGGLARSADDPRDMFPAMTEAIASLAPKAFVVENVKGLTRASFQDYFSYIQLRLEHPQLRPHKGENWRQHFARLEFDRGGDLEYNLVTTVVNAADFGVPQQRHRVFLVGFRSDLGIQWEFPKPTHSGHQLAYQQMTGEYWDKHAIPTAQQQILRKRPIDDGLLPWVTVREALMDLPHPQNSDAKAWPDHNFQPGAKIYPGHTGSPIDQPSKALKAGSHGVPGGENMIRYPNGDVRYYTIRESARIQTFPDDYILHGAWTEVMRQLGNAVPVKLAEKVMSSVANELRLNRK